MNSAALHEAMVRGQRRAAAVLLRAHPHWPLAELFEYIEAGGHLSTELASLSLAELRNASSAGVIDLTRLARAQQVDGEAFGVIVVQILAEAGQPVRAGYLRQRAGGPRWKLSKALHRLAERGLVERAGSTSNTTWHYVGRR